MNKDAVIKTFTSEGYFYIPSILPFFDAVNPPDAELSGIQITSHCLAGYVRCEPNTRISVEVITPAYKVDAALRLCSNGRLAHSVCTFAIFKCQRNNKQQLFIR